jgi:hypothetical protein
MSVKMRKFHPLFGGLHWEFENEKGDVLSVVCHTGSYSWMAGKFEVYPSWAKDVSGYLSFSDVAKWIKKLERRERANRKAE